MCFQKKPAANTEYVEQGESLGFLYIEGNIRGSINESSRKDMGGEKEK